MPGSALMRAASALAIASTTSFSRVPRLPDAPGIDAAMAGIDGDHDVAAGIAGRMRGTNGHRRRGNRRRDGDHVSATAARSA